MTTSHAHWQEGFHHKYEYALVGHSGDGADIPFVEFGEPPKNRKERLQVRHARLSPNLIASTIHHQPTHTNTYHPHRTHSCVAEIRT